MLVLLSCIEAFGANLASRHVAVILHDEQTVDCLEAPKYTKASNDAAAKIWLAASRLNMQLKVHLNTNDQLDFYRDHAEDYQLHPRVFHELCKTWTTPSIDRFASAQLPLFNS